ncbi:hypothetical protein ACS0TY_018570 [Phlomoides rotata]
MGRRDSSSKTKSSKRKRDKISFKKKSRRKDRKTRRICDSVTANSVDNLLNSGNSPPPTLKSDHRRRINKKGKGHRDSSLSSYSDYESLTSDSDSGIAYKNRKARRSQVGLKDRKKRGRKRSASPNGEVVKKRKRLDRDSIVKPPIKKTSKKKFSKYSSSSSSSDSDCQSRSSGSTADDVRRKNKVILNKDIERHRGRGSHKGMIMKMQKVRSPRSSCDRDIEPGISISNNDEALFPTSSSRRLRSVIVVVNQSHDVVENRWEMDPHTEEIDSSSLKIVDSNEGGGRMESSSHSNGAFCNRICAENIAVEEAPELGKSRIDIGDLDKAGDHELEGAHMNDSGKQKEIDVFVPEAASGGEILESMLRQKALERLRKFQQRLQTGPRSTTVKMNDESDVGTVNIVQNKLIEGSSNTLEINKTSVVSSKGEFSRTVDEDKKLPDSGHFEKDPGIVKQSFTRPPKEVKNLVECSEEDKSVNACSSSAMEPSSVGPISGERGNEAKDGSHFQQKTMSVMRGGEQVQVSYKVYIPKKAPALARRQLRRFC